MKFSYFSPILLVFAMAIAAQGQSNQSNDVEAKFKKWKAENGKSYSTKTEEKKAEKNFEKTVKANEDHNKRKNETYKCGTSEHSDMSYAEKVKKRMGVNRSFSNNRVRRSAVINETTKEEPVPDSVDYRANLTAIKNQGRCGACWAFAAAVVLEHSLKIKRNLSIQVSEQELLDCNENGMDCEVGGWPTGSFEYAQNKGLGDAEKYEYLAYTTECSNNRIKRVIKTNRTCELDMEGNEEDMKWLVANHGSMAVVMWATDKFTSYKSGVYYEEDCPTSRVNHAVAIVGYGTDPEFGDFWWVRNSWGEKWGIKGYAKFARNRGNSCGISSTAMFACHSAI